MAQIVKSTHPKTKAGQAYACGGQVKKYANGGEIEGAPVVVTTPLAIPVGQPIKSAGEAVGGVLGEAKSKLMRGMEGAKSLFKSPEAKAAERAAADAEMIRKASQ